MTAVYVSPRGKPKADQFGSPCPFLDIFVIGDPVPDVSGLNGTSDDLWHARVGATGDDPSFGCKCSLKTKIVSEDLFSTN